MLSCATFDTMGKGALLLTPFVGMVHLLRVTSVQLTPFSSDLSKLLTLLPLFALSVWIYRANFVKKSVSQETGN